MHQKETSYLRDYEFYCEEEVNMVDINHSNYYSCRIVPEKSLKWRHAMDQEISSIEKTQTCILSHLLQGE
uniref:Uncharacterized protein n=1 Tax=Brassica oleracea TaxID=3712 RepID=A0A3P6FHD9_BRAOL|nr:unnamed protein product [Brassica oleracea]